RDEHVMGAAHLDRSGPRLRHRLDHAAALGLGAVRGEHDEHLGILRRRTSPTIVGLRRGVLARALVRRIGIRLRARGLRRLASPRRSRALRRSQLLPRSRALRRSGYSRSVPESPLHPLVAANWKMNGTREDAV